MNQRMIILKQQLRAILKERDMTAAQLARLSGLPRQTLADWLSGSPPRDIRQVKQVADTLKLSMDFLCFGTQPQMPEVKTMDLDELIGVDWISGLFEVKFRRVRR